MMVVIVCRLNSSELQKKASNSSDTFVERRSCFLNKQMRPCTMYSTAVLLYVQYVQPCAVCKMSRYVTAVFVFFSDVTHDSRK